MAITASDVALEARIIAESSQTIPEAMLARIERYLAAGREAISAFAPAAPETQTDLALLLYCAYLIDKPSVSTQVYAHAFTNSGAASVLSRYRVKKAVSVRGDGAKVTSSEASSEASSPVDMAAIDAAISGHAALPNVHHTPGVGMGGSVEAWATPGNPALIPADKYRAPTSSSRGAIPAGTNSIIDTDSNSNLLAWSLNHIRRMINRIVPGWAQDDTTPIPAEKLTNAPSGSGSGSGDSDEIEVLRPMSEIPSGLSFIDGATGLDGDDFISISVITSGASAPAGDTLNLQFQNIPTDSTFLAGNTRGVEVRRSGQTLQIKRSGSSNVASCGIYKLSGERVTVSDTTARAAAAAAQTSANAAQTSATANANKLMPVPNAEATLAVATTIRGWTAAAVRRVVEAIVPLWARAANPPAGSGGGASWTLEVSNQLLNIASGQNNRFKVIPNFLIDYDKTWIVVQTNDTGSRTHPTVWLSVAILNSWTNRSVDSSPTSTSHAYELRDVSQNTSLYFAKSNAALLFATSNDAYDPTFYIWTI